MQIVDMGGQDGCCAGSPLGSVVEGLNLGPGGCDFYWLDWVIIHMD
jgi:hypothetical protein